MERDSSKYPLKVALFKFVGSTVYSSSSWKCEITVSGSQ
jgi:hypothetical protein